MKAKNYIQFVLIAVQLLLVWWELHRMKKGKLSMKESWTLCGIVCSLGVCVFAAAFLG